MEEYGFKVFLKGLKNVYSSRTYEVGQTYLYDGSIQYGNNGHGFHFCRNLEDCLRFFDAHNEEIEIAFVRGFGHLKKYDDEYYGYFDMFVSSGIEIIKVLTREEVIEYMLETIGTRQLRFMRDFPLTEEEKKLFETKELNEARKLFRY